jgi:putative tryptophan/tyrosine transport system substrate-binding protein
VIEFSSRSGAVLRRRDFIKLAGSATAAWPLVARAQQSRQPRIVGILVDGLQTDAEIEARLAAFRKALQDLGWNPGSNLRVEIRYGIDDDVLLQGARELASLAPDVVLAVAPPAVMALLSVTRTIPIVFTAVTDPVGSGFVQKLSHPGGNATGFLTSEFGFGAKWLELLKEIAPNVRRVAVITDPDNRGAAPQFATIQAAAPSVGVELIPISLRDKDSIEQEISDFTRSGNGGLIALRVPKVMAERKSIIALAASHRLPAVYPLPLFAADGGLIAYGPNVVDQFRQAASYVDRILKGEKPADLPVQAPTKYQLAINLKTAKALGLAVPTSLLARADEVIE